MSLTINSDTNEIVSERKITTYGTSTGVSIPLSMLSDIDFEKGDQIEVAHEIGTDIIKIRPCAEDSDDGT